MWVCTTGSCCFYGQGGKQHELCCGEGSVGVWEGCCGNVMLYEDVFLCKGCCIREDAHVAFLGVELMLLCVLSFGGAV